MPRIEDYRKPELSGLGMKGALLYLEDRYGPDEVDIFLSSRGISREYLKDPNNWISYNLAHDLLARLRDMVHTEKACRDAGTYTIKPEALGRAIWIAMKSVGTPASVFKRVIQHSKVFNRVGSFQIIQMKKNSILLEYRPKQAYREEDKLFCHYRMGQFSAIPTIWGLPSADCNEVSCIAEGAETCTYEFTWQEKPSLLYPLTGMMVGALLSLAHAKVFSTEHVILFWSMSLLLPVAGFLGGEVFFLLKALRHNRGVNKEQQEALEVSLNDISDKYLELQHSNAALEETHKELKLHKDHLEELVDKRTRELQESKIQLEESYEKLKELDKMKMRFFANINHELRTPLTLTLSPVESMLQGEMGEVNEQQREYLTNIHTNALRLLKLINNLLDLAKLEEGKMSLQYGMYCLPECICEIVESFQLSGRRKGITVTVEGNHDIPTVFFDRDKIEKVMINLLGNALKFTPEGGSVVVRWNEEEEYVKVSVSDTGPGIPKTELERIFDRFVQVDDSLKRRYGGTGIGLALAKEIIELHGGTIVAQNRSEGGAVFSFTIPKGEKVITEILDVEASSDWSKRLYNQADYVEEVERGSPVGNDVEMYGKGQGSERGVNRDRAPCRVLVVEDNSEMRKFIVDCLKKDFEVLAAIDGEDGCAKARKELPDLVISDIMMPHKNGYELCEEIKGDRGLCHIPVILLSSKSDVSMKVEGFEHGADDYMTKPFNPRELVARVHNMIRIHRLEREIQRRSQELEAALNELKVTQTHLVHSAKMASLGVLSAGLAHEINNPLNAALSSMHTLLRTVEHLKEGTPGETELLLAKMSRSAERSITGLKRCEEIITGLRRFSRKDVEGKREEDIHEGIDSTLSLLPHESGRDITIHRDYRFMGRLYCDIGQLNQVFMNLITNAYHAVGVKGDIWIRTDQKEEEVVISVEDSGHGISSENISRIFEPFFTTKDVGEGTGLGLSIAHKIIEDHGGRIEVHSTVGKGSTFSVYIPLRNDSHARQLKRDEHNVWEVAGL